jgi:hypothetical protein
MDERTLQTDLWSLRPQVRGGRATRDRYGISYLRELGRRGGTTTRDRYGLAYMRALGKLGQAARRARSERAIRVIVFADGERQRLIPYLRHGRRRIEWVRFYLTWTEKATHEETGT